MGQANSLATGVNAWLHTPGPSEQAAAWAAKEEARRAELAQAQQQAAAAAAEEEEDERDNAANGEEEKEEKVHPNGSDELASSSSSLSCGFLFDPDHPLQRAEELRLGVVSASGSSAGRVEPLSPSQLVHPSSPPVAFPPAITAARVQAQTQQRRSLKPPPRVLSAIYSFLPLPDMLRAARCSRQYYAAAQREESVGPAPLRLALFPSPHAAEQGSSGNEESDPLRLAAQHVILCNLRALHLGTAYREEEEANPIATAALRRRSVSKQQQSQQQYVSPESAEAASTPSPDAPLSVAVHIREEGESASARQDHMRAQPLLEMAPVGSHSRTVSSVSPPVPASASSSPARVPYVSELQLSALSLFPNLTSLSLAYPVASDAAAASLTAVRLQRFFEPLSHSLLRLVLHPAADWVPPPSTTDQSLSPALRAQLIQRCEPWIRTVSLLSSLRELVLQLPVAPHLLCAGAESEASAADASSLEPTPQLDLSPLAASRALRMLHLCWPIDIDGSDEEARNTQKTAQKIAKELEEQLPECVVVAAPI